MNLKCSKQNCHGVRTTIGIIFTKRGFVFKSNAGKNSARGGTAAVVEIQPLDAFHVLQDLLSA